jgi:hypothetical protein
VRSIFDQDLAQGKVVLDRRFQTQVPDSSPNEAPPNGFICPLTLDLMENPMVASNGRSYEASSLEQLFNQPYPMDAITREPLDPNIRIPNKLLKQIIDTYNRTKAVDDNLLRTPTGYYQQPYIGQNGETHEGAKGGIGIEVENLNIKLLIGELNPDDVLKEIKTEFRAWSSRVVGLPEELLMRFEQTVDEFVAFNLTLEEIKQITQIFKEALYENHWAQFSDDNELYSKAWDKVKTEMDRLGFSLRLFKHKTVDEFTQRGLDALDMLNVSQEILTRDYGVSDPTRLLRILETGINASRDAILAGQDSILDTVFESALLAEYGETRTEEEKQHGIPQYLIDKTRKYIALCQTYEIPHQGEEFLFADIRRGKSRFT